jgi:hypothetical protein
MADGSSPVRILPLGEIEDYCEAVRLDLDSLDNLRNQIIDQWNPDAVLVHLMTLCCDNARKNLSKISQAATSDRP